MNQRVVFQCAAVMFFLAAGSGLLLQGSFTNFVVLVPFIYLLLAWSAAIFVALVLAVFRRRLTGLKVLVIGWVLLATSIGLSLLTGYGVHSYHTLQARRYVARATEALEIVKVESGLYPKQLSEKQFGAFPHFLNAASYNSDGNTFSFTYSDPADMMGGYVFSSKTHQWIYWD